MIGLALALALQADVARDAADAAKDAAEAGARAADAQTARELQWLEGVKAFDWSFGGFASDDTAIIFTKRPLRPGPAYPRLWVRIEVKDPLEDGSLSLSYLSEFDCATGRSRDLTYSTFRKHNLNDMIVSSDKVENWKEIRPDTFAGTSFLIACPAPKATTKPRKSVKK